MANMTCEEHLAALTALDIQSVVIERVQGNECVEVDVASHYCDHILDAMQSSAGSTDLVESMLLLIKLTPAIQGAVAGIFAAGYRLAERDRLEKYAASSRGDDIDG
jgi:hypothetical protein